MIAWHLVLLLLLLLLLLPPVSLDIVRLDVWVGAIAWKSFSRSNYNKKKKSGELRCWLQRVPRTRRCRRQELIKPFRSCFGRTGGEGVAGSQGGIQCKWANDDSDDDGIEAEECWNKVERVASGVQSINRRLIYFVQLSMNTNCMKSMGCFNSKLICCLSLSLFSLLFTTLKRYFESDDVDWEKFLKIGKRQNKK